MTVSNDASHPNWDDDDLPEWTDEQIARSQLSDGGEIIRAATGTLTRTGRPTMGIEAKKQVTLRLDPDVVERFRAGGRGWQSRMNAALRLAVGL